MTKGAPSDDFFGIEYVSSSYTAQGPEKDHSPVEETPRSSNSNAKQLPGSKFMDQAFFPEIMERSGNENIQEEKPRDSGTDFLEKQYFSGLEGGDKQRFSDEFYEKIGQKVDFKQKIPSSTMKKSHHELFYEANSPQKEENGPVVGHLARKNLEANRKRRQTEEKETDMVRNEPEPRIQQKKGGKRKRQDSRRDFDGPQEKEQAMTVIQTLRANMPPVQGMSQDLLVEYLANRIIFQNSNLVAFDKPYGLPYSGSKLQNQFDRLLQVLKARVAPKVERLHLVRSLDLQQSGIILFATPSLPTDAQHIAEIRKRNLIFTKTRSYLESVQRANQSCYNAESALAQSEAQDQLKEATLTHRCLVKGTLDESIEITIPLVKKLYENKGKPQFKLLPLFTNQTQKQIFHGTTLLKPLASVDGVSYIEAETKNEVPHQLRCHLSLAKLTLFDDHKYGSTDPSQPLKYPKPFLNRLGLTETQGRKLPMHSHLQQMRFPSANVQQPDIVIRAPMPPHFTWLLQKLKLLKR